MNGRYEAGRVFLLAQSLNRAEVKRQVRTEKGSGGPVGNLQIGDSFEFTDIVCDAYSIKMSGMSCYDVYKHFPGVYFKSPI